MKYIFRILAVAGLLLTLIPSLLFYLGSMEEVQMKSYMFIGAMIWFAGAIPWLGQKRSKT